MNTRVANLKHELKPTRNDEVGEELAVADSVVTAAALGDKSTHALISVKSQNVHVTFDGTDPAQDGAGLQLTAGYLEPWTKYTLASARFIRAGSSSGVVRIEPMSA